MTAAIYEVEWVIERGTEPSGQYTAYTVTAVVEYVPGGGDDRNEPRYPPEWFVCGNRVTSIEGHPGIALGEELELTGDEENQIAEYAAGAADDLRLIKVY